MPSLKGLGIKYTAYPALKRWAIVFRLAGRDSVRFGGDAYAASSENPHPSQKKARMGHPARLGSFPYNSPVRNCARPLPKLQSTSVLVTIETMTSLASIPQEFFNSRHSSA